MIPFKRRLLEAAWTNFSAGADRRLAAAFEQFCNEQAHWLDDYALFRALESSGITARHYLEWPAELVRRAPAALASARRELTAPDRQVLVLHNSCCSAKAARLQEHAHAKGVRLIGDLPFFVSPDSSDVWANPELFLLDEQYRPLFVAGVPPDYFSATGQLWGNPVYNWDALRRTGYRWCIDRLRASAGPCRSGSAGSFPRHSPPPGTCPPGGRRRNRANGCRARAPSFSSAVQKGAWRNCRSSPKTWA